MRESGPSFLDAGIPTDNGIEPDNHDNSPFAICDMAKALSKLNVPTAYMRAYKTTMAEYLVQEGFTASDIVESIDDAIDLTLHQSRVDHFIQFVEFGRFP